MPDNPPQSAHAETLTLIRSLLPLLTTDNMTADQVIAYQRLVSRINSWGFADKWILTEYEDGRTGRRVTRNPDWKDSDAQ